MLIALQIMSGPTAGRKAYVRAGQVLQVGRTEWADFAVPHDSAMSDIHFSLECQPAGCQLRDLSNGRGVMVNGRPSSEAPVQHGDQITAGQTRFVVHLEGAAGLASGPLSHGENPGNASTTTAQPSGVAKPAKEVSAAKICEHAGLGEESLTLLNDEIGVTEFIKLLGQKNLWPDAVRFLAHLLPKREAVWWACLCVRSASAGKLSPADAAAVQAAEAWVLDPNEDRRRAAMTAADATQHKTAAGWAAIGAFWSGGSLAPAGLPEVPPDEHLMGKGVSGAVLMAAVSGKPQDAAPNFAQFAKLGAEVAQGRHLWPNEQKPPKK
jgi:pSer/pThr/pTyr-binding forkhead associated (FHA) protein